MDMMIYIKTVIHHGHVGTEYRSLLKNANTQSVAEYDVA